MEKKGIIINILVVLVVLGIVFFSQSASWRSQNGARAENPTKAQGGILTGPKGGLPATMEQKRLWVGEWVTQQKDAAVKNIWERIKIYFAEKFSKFSGTKVE